MQRIVPCFWFNRTAADAVELYSTAFDDLKVISEHRYPDEGLPDFQKPFAGELLTVDFEIAGYRIFGINADDKFKPNYSVSLLVNFDPSVDPQAREHLDQAWAALTKEGRELMPLGEYPFSPHYAWVEDRFGVSWQLILTDPEGDPRPKIIPNIMFGAGVQGRAQEAIDFYTEVFGGSVGQVYHYPENAPEAGQIMFSDYQLLGQWFASNDGPGQEESFTCGTSFMVQCEDQSEIDRLWESLSKVPEAEACGWCADQFGLSWQILPNNLGELMSKPGAHEKLLAMKKLEIAGF